MKAVVIGVLIAIAACGSSSSPNATRTFAVQGHIHGTFTLHAGPVQSCPTPSAGLLCAAFTQPIAGAVIVVVAQSGKVATRTTTDAQGAFEITLAPGTYTVQAPTENEPGTYGATVHVASMQTVSANLQVSEP